MADTNPAFWKHRFKESPSSATNNDQKLFSLYRLEESVFRARIFMIVFDTVLSSVDSNATTMNGSYTTLS
ncbi:hypothetical protein D3C87_1565910 [compost metagenome]